MGRKGNLVIGQSGGPTAVINNSLVGVVQEAMQHAEIEGIYGMLHGIRGIMDDELIDMRGESAQTLERLRDTPASALGTVRYKVKKKDYDPIVDMLQAHNVRYFFYVGGNDSMDTSLQIHMAAQRRGYELCVIGVPKTVDNDLDITDHCPGFGSAARFVAAAVRNTSYDTRAMGDSGPIKLIEIMGRNAGWLTATAALARESVTDAPHLIYVPEHPIRPEQIVSDVQAVYAKYGYCVAAVSEGVLKAKDQPYGAAGAVDAFGHVAKGGVVEEIADIIAGGTGLRARFDKPNYLQRSFGELQSATDREEAYEAGRAAVRAAVAGVSGQMVTLVRQPGAEYECTTGLAPLDQVANEERKLPSEYINAAGNDVTEAFLEYARPLIGGPLRPYARLSAQAVPRK